MESTDSVKTSKSNPKTTASIAKTSTNKSAHTPPTPILDNGVFYKDDKLQCYAFVDLTPRADTFSDHQPTKDTWRIQIGDHACIQVTNSKNNISYPPGSAKKSYPFTVQWRPCQILSIFRERPSKLKKSWDALKVEVRWFYRLSDLDDRNAAFEKANKMGKNEILESGHVSILDANSLLGRLVLGSNVKVEDRVESNGVVPSVVNLCYRYYLHEEKDILQLFDGESMVARGLECSSKLKRSRDLKKLAHNYLKLSVPASEVGSSSKDQNIINLTPHAAHIKYKNGEKSFYSSALLTYPWSMLSHRSLICPIEQRGNFAKWQLCVGDVVAVPCDSSLPPCGADNIPGRDKWYPYSKPWSHAQVIAIYRNGVTRNDLVNEQNMTPVFASEVQVRIRWLNRISEAISEAEKNKEQKKIERLQKIANDPSRTAEKVLEGRELTEINCDMILGPVRIDDAKDISPRKKGYTTSCEESSPVSPFMVQNRRVVETAHGAETLLCRGLNACDLFNKSQMKTYRDNILLTRQKRMDEMQSLAPKIEGTATGSSTKDQESAADRSKMLPKKRLFDEKSPASPTRTSPRKKGKTPMQLKVKKDVPLKSSNRKQEQVEDCLNAALPRVFCTTSPFHVDVSAKKSFYTEFAIRPPLDSYHTNFLSKINRSESSEPWIVKMGDTVTLEVETDSKSSGSLYPFNVAWSPAEVVSIFREHTSKNACIKLRDSIQGKKENVLSAVDVGDIDADDIKMEIRWLYRRHDIPGKLNTSPNKARTSLEEVFETDHLDICSADSILSPLVIHDHWKQENEVDDIVKGLPCINYHCFRFWSSHRKSFVPSGSMSQRIFRGRMHSGFFGRKGDRTAQLALKRLEGHEGSVPTADQPEMSWQEAFHSAIKTLSLAEAAQDVQEGATLLCRDDERSNVLDFLRTAICGRQGMAVKSSMFIAGPPGTGKTATVRSVIAELKEEQSKGDLPEFQFVDLNGMELMNPFDAYIKFWESISGIKKESLTAGESAACLDSYFCEDSEDYGDYEGEIARKPVTVLLLDEIDYLVTKQETVLYSFFDWPLRAVPSAKLIVVGIANTLNLPERLSPKLASRMGQKRIFFGAFNDEEIVTIIKERLGMVGNLHDPTKDVFDIDAIRFAARKTANRSGDIRKAFNLCKVAAESVYQARINAIQRRVLTSKDPRPIVSTKDVVRASNDALSRIMIKAMSCSTDYQACLLIAIGSSLKGREDQGRITLTDLRTKMVSIADASGEPQYEGVTLIHNYALNDMVTSLTTSGILNMYTDIEGYTPRPLIGMNVSLYDIIAAFKDTPHSALANKHLTEVLDF